jgi:hypothetical protein
MGKMVSCRIRVAIASFSGSLFRRALSSPSVHWRRFNSPARILRPLASALSCRRCLAQQPLGGTQQPGAHGIQVDIMIDGRSPAPPAHDEINRSGKFNPQATWHAKRSPKSPLPANSWFVMPFRHPG